jgi:pyruvate dehydrogenase E1 component
MGRPRKPLRSSGLRGFESHSFRSSGYPRRLRRGGHDPRKVHAAYRAALDHRDAPTVILAHTVKGWALGPGFEARNATHQKKKMSEMELRTFRDRLELPITDERLSGELPPYVHPGFESDEYEYLMAAGRRSVAGCPPAWSANVRSFYPGGPYAELVAGTGDSVSASTTSAFTRLLRNLLLSYQEATATRKPPTARSSRKTSPRQARWHR